MMIQVRIREIAGVLRTVAVLPLTLASLLILPPAETAAQALASIADIGALAPFPNSARMGECTSECASILNPCDAGYHYAFDAGPEGNHSSGEPHTNEPPEGCLENTCTQMHPLDCGDLAAFDEKAVAAAVASDDAAYLTRLISERPQNLEINQQRQALQIIDCHGHAIAHLPISDALIQTFMNEAEAVGSKSS